MPDRFLDYLQQERRRLEHELERARTHGADRVEVARLDQLRRIVADQLARWSADLQRDEHRAARVLVLP